METFEYIFRIDAFTPDTMPMARLADYMAALADLIGSKENTHFIRLDEGSARLVHRIEAPAIPKFERRLADVFTEAAPKDLTRAFKTLDELLVEDNATGELIGPTGTIILPFPGRSRPRPLAFPAFRQDGSIEGQIVSVGGKDATAHVILQDHSITYSGCTLKREMAKQLARYLYGPNVRLVGSGRWERHPDGTWKLLEFRVDRYEVLDERPLAEVLADVRALPNNDLAHDQDVYGSLIDLRLGDGDIH